MKLTAAIPVIAVVCLVSTAGAQKVTRPPKAPQAPRASQPVFSAPAKSPSPESHPASPQYLEKLLKLTPEQRSKALGALPPPRRAQVLAKLENYQRIPPQQRARELEYLQRLQNLPPQKRSQVRASLKKFQDIPQPRHQQIQKQINQFKRLSDADRRAVINSEEFRNKFTPAEQQMLEDISLVTPRG